MTILRAMKLLNEIEPLTEDEPIEGCLVQSHEVNKAFAIIREELQSRQRKKGMGA
jgi:hypothetical protein